MFWHRCLTRCRTQSDHGKQEQYIDVRLQVQELRDALARRSAEIEELQAARDHLPTSVRRLRGKSRIALLISWIRMSNYWHHISACEMSLSRCDQLCPARSATKYSSQMTFSLWSADILCVISKYGRTSNQGGIHTDGPIAGLQDA